MSAKKIISPLLKIVFLIAAAWGLYELSHAKNETTIAIPDDDDIATSPRVSVRVAPIARATLRQVVSAFGVVEPAPATADFSAAYANLSAPSGALVTDVLVTEGQTVDRGQVLLKLDSRTADSPIARSQLVSEIPSPIAGVVTGLSIRPGEISQPGQSIQITDLKRLIIAARIPASSLPLIKVGQPAEFDVPLDRSTPTAQPAIGKGSVILIDKTVDDKSGMGSIDISVPVSAGLMPGQFVKVRVSIAEHQNCMAVSAESVINDIKGRPSVSVVVRDFRWAVRQPVEIGIRDRDRVEIRSADLKGDETIVTTGAAALTDNCRIEVEK